MIWYAVIKSYKVYSIKSTNMANKCVNRYKINFICASLVALSHSHDSDCVFLSHFIPLEKRIKALILCDNLEGFIKDSSTFDSLPEHYFPIVCLILSKFDWPKRRIEKKMQKINYFLCSS